MAGSDKASANQALATMTSQSSLDAILRGLTDRPNVESTLILSRKDGSIIKVAGFATAEKRRRAQSATALSGERPTRAATNGDATSAAYDEETIAALNINVEASPAEELASSIFHFVKAAASLGTTLCTVAAVNDEDDASPFRRVQQGDGAAIDASKTGVEDSEDFRRESQVQLMRLRIKSREVIIFPDPQYLCCVVQRIGKPGAAVDSR